MLDFNYLLPTKMIFGKNAEATIGEEVKKYSSNILLVHYGDDFIKNSKIIERISKSLKTYDIKYTELCGIQPNPVSDPVYEGIKICKENNIDFILTVGGGSVIDTGKAIAVGVPYEGDVYDFYQMKEVPTKAIPVACITTIPASGSETSNGSVISFGEHKLCINYEIIRPKFSVFNPSLTLTLPPWQTFCGIADIIDHIFERYFSSTIESDLIGSMCEGAIKSVMKNARILLKDPQNYNARAEITLAASIAHNGMLDMGRMQDWGTHNMGHQLSVLYGATHGATISAIRPSWIRYNYKRDMDLFVNFAVRIMNVEFDAKNPQHMILEAVEKLENFYREIGLPIKISEINNIDKNVIDIDKMTQLAAPVGFSFPLEADNIKEIYKMSM